MPTLLVVHHTTSPAMHSMFDAVMSGATDARIEGVDVVARAALAATAVDVLAADGYLLGTPANLGYMSGALKHFFDQITTPVSTPPPGGRTACGYTPTTTPPAPGAASRSSPRASSGAPRRSRSSPSGS